MQNSQKIKKGHALFTLCFAPRGAGKYCESDVHYRVLRPIDANKDKVVRQARERLGLSADNYRFVQGVRYTRTDRTVLYPGIFE
jgi:hypothetical protein